MNFAEAQDIQDQVRERRATHWIVRLITPAKDEYREMPKSDAARLVFGFFPASMLDGATVYAAGAVNPETRGREFVALPSPGWKGKS